MGTVAAYELNPDLLTRLKSDKDGDRVLVCSKDDKLSDILKNLEVDKNTLDVVVLGRDFSEPIQMAQRIHAVDKMISTVVIVARSELARVKQAFQFSLGIGEFVDCISDADIDHVLDSIKKASFRTRSRRHTLQILNQANLGLAQAAHRPKAESYHLDKISDFAPIGVALIDIHGKILGWNRKAAELVSLVERDAVSYPLDKFFQFPSKTSFLNFISEAVQSNQARTVQVTCELKSGIRFFELTLGRLSETELGSLMVVFHDITEQVFAAKNLEEAKQEAERANQLKSTFLANMSHEIRTPIGAILGFLELMKQPGNSPSELNDFIMTIDRNGHQLLRLIDDILDLSKVEAGKIQVQYSKMSLRALLEEMNSFMNFRSREKGLSFEFQIVSAIPEYIESDVVRLRQILSNLIGNAIKFTETGKIEVVVEYKGGLLKFLISDTGIGMAPEQVEKLFEPFMQADPSITRKFGGTGLGLALSKRLTEALGGTLRVIETAVGKGTKFELQIAVQELPDTKLFTNEELSSDGIISSATMSVSKRLSNMKVLVVDDSPDNRVLVSRILSIQGAMTDFAENGLLGIERATSTLYDVILMDMQMPVCGGLEATKRLRENGYDKPIVALTAHAMEDERKKAFAAGCTDYLTKPINTPKLIAVLERYK